MPQRLDRVELRRSPRREEAEHDPREGARPDADAEGEGARRHLPLEDGPQDGDGADPQERAELRADLSLLRRHFGDKIDEIAMTFGVEEAMKARDTVERTVVVPRDLKPLNIRRQEEVSSEESGETGYGL